MNDKLNSNIQLTVLPPAEDTEGEIRIDFSAIWEGFRRFLSLWLVLAIALGAVAAGCALAIQRFFYVGDAEALISFGNGASSSSSTIINQFRSPNVLNGALNAMNIDLGEIENIRRNLKIAGVVPDSSYDRLTLSYELLSNGGSLDIVDALLNTPHTPSRYVLAFDYQKANYTREEGIALLNEILASYRDFYDEHYNYSSAFGSPLAIIDYTEYDYAEAANIFTTTLNEILSYLSGVSSSETTVFRSSETGYTFQDLYRIASMLKDVELDRLNSYIYIHSVSSYDLETVVSHYEWLIEQAQQRKNVLETKYESLTDSIAAYEKDPIIYAIRESNTVAASDRNINNAYDDMIRQKLSTRSSISACQSTIEYYQSMIERFQTNDPPSQQELETVDGYLASLSENMNRLIDNMDRTANEFYDKAAFVRTLQVLVPASAAGIPIISRTSLIIFLIVEVLLFFVYLFQSVAYGLKKANRGKKSKGTEQTEKGKDVPVPVPEG